ncbi:MAG: TorF family putative porin [Acetobacteraceae bacterium]|nr:TorF family putative porin [Acetobacteraceae bacterium]
MRKSILTAAALCGLAAPATAQVRLGETGLSVTATGTFASDYLFRGISQTRSRPAWQLSNVEVSHSSGVYVGAFVSNVRFAGTDARQEIDVFGGYRFSLAGFNLDAYGIWYTYPGFTRQGGQPRLNYAEAVIKATREIGPVTLSATLAGSPNFFGSSGTGIYLEGGADWKTGLWDLTVQGRLGHQWIERNPRFGTPDYLWWSVGLARDFTITGIGTVTASVGYYQTSIARADCAPIGGRGQDICGARALGSISFKF